MQCPLLHVVWCTDPSTALSWPQRVSQDAVQTQAESRVPCWRAVARAASGPDKVGESPGRCRAQGGLCPLEGKAGESPQGGQGWHAGVQCAWCPGFCDFILGCVAGPGHYSLRAFQIQGQSLSRGQQNTGTKDPDPLFPVPTYADPSPPPTLPLIPTSLPPSHLSSYCGPGPIWGH